jgi:radical SAM protein with 4Fe4S-binding SPASM domain
VRVSLDGPREVDERQRGAGSYDKAMAGLEALAREKRATGSPTPALEILYTVTRENHLAIEQFFLRELDLAPIASVTIQMQNFVTESMGEAYSRLLESKFGLSSQRYWRSMLRTPEDFDGMDTVELARQVAAVGKRLQELGKRLLLLPPTFSPANLDAYLRASWGEMTDRYRGCAIPWLAADITARGELAPCHVFYDLVLGSLHQHSIRELWNGEGYRRFREEVKQSGLTPICPGCCILYLVNRPSRAA